MADEPFNEKQARPQNTVRLAMQRAAKPSAHVKISAHGITKVFQDDKQGRVVAFSDLSLEVAEGEFICLLGPSGCGKTTLLMSIAGFEPLSSGQILLDGVAISGPGPDRGVVFQEYALFPWRTVRRNVEYGLEVKRVSRVERRRLANELLERVGLQGFSDHYPFQLSGGMKQRVAIARSLAVNPSVLLMDEPFGALDALTRGTLQRETERIWEATRKTIVFVTHNVSEAILLGDRVIVFSPRPGRIKADIRVPLPRPRSALSSQFISIRRDIEAVMQEVLQANIQEMGD